MGIQCKLILKFELDGADGLWKWYSIQVKLPLSPHPGMVILISKVQVVVERVEVSVDYQAIGVFSKLDDRIDHGDSDDLEEVLVRSGWQEELPLG